jgi:hypothetical protein
VAKATGFVCDRCKGTIRNSGGVHKISYENLKKGSGWTKMVEVDLCKMCNEQFHSFLVNSDVGSSGSSFVLTETPCDHHIPCAGPCGTTVLKRIYPTRDIRA